MGSGGVGRGQVLQVRDAAPCAPGLGVRGYVGGDEGSV